MIAEKKCTQKFKKKKKFSLGKGLNPQLSWLTTVCLHGFDRNVSQLFLVFSLHQCLQHVVKSKQKQIWISNQHIQVPRCNVFNFAQVWLRCVLGIPSNSSIKAEFKKCVCKKYDFEKKRSYSPPGFEPTTL